MIVTSAIEPVPVVGALAGKERCQNEHHVLAWKSLRTGPTGNHLKASEKK